MMRSSKSPDCPQVNMKAPEITFSSEMKRSLKIGSKEYFSAYDFSLTEKEIEKACKDFQETEEKKIRKLQELRDKLANDKGVNYRTDTPYLLRYLRVRKYDATKTYQNLKEGYIVKNRHPEAYRIADLDQLLSRNIFMNLPYTDEEGNVLFHFDLEKWKCEEVSIDGMAQISMAFSDLFSMNPRMQVNGFIHIWDMKGLSAQHITSTLRSWGLREMSFGFQHMYPWRVKKLIAINTGPLTRLFHAMIRPVLSKKISERIVVLGSDIKDLHQHVNPVLLPKKLGGFLEDNQCSWARDGIIDNIPYLKYERSFFLSEKL